MPRFTINDGGYEVTAATPEAAVAADLRAAGYAARVAAGDVVVEASAEHLAGVALVRGPGNGGRPIRVTVRVGERRAAGKIATAGEARAVLNGLEKRARAR